MEAKPVKIVSSLPLFSGHGELETGLFKFYSSRALGASYAQQWRMGSQERKRYFCQDHRVSKQQAPNIKEADFFFYFIFIYLLDNFIIIIFISIFCFSVPKKVSHLHESLSLLSNLVFGYLPLFQMSNCNSTIPFEL